MYKITIEETVTVKKMEGKEWKILSEKDGERERGYTPEIEKEVKETQIIYIQTIDTLNLVNVINAVNGVVT